MVRSVQFVAKRLPRHSDSILDHDVIKNIMSAPPDTGPSFQDVVRRLEKLEAASSDSVNIDVMKLIY